MIRTSLALGALAFSALLAVPGCNGTAPTKGTGATTGKADSVGGDTDDLYACNVDSDCVAISKGGCCPEGWKIAVNADHQDEYVNVCNEQIICPLYVVLDTRQPECVSGQCTMVAIDQISCGGFVANPHQCPSGYQCVSNGVPDQPGSCKSCVDNVACIQGTHWDANACACMPDPPPPPPAGCGSDSDCATGESCCFGPPTVPPRTSGFCAQICPI
jgi:hypothetical protein